MKIIHDTYIDNFFLLYLHKYINVKKRHLYFWFFPIFFCLGSQVLPRYAAGTTCKVKIIDRDRKQESPKRGFPLATTTQTSSHVVKGTNVSKIV